MGWQAGEVEARWWPQTLRTERLILRPVAGDDRPWLIGLRTDPEVRRYLGGARTVHQAEQEVSVELRPDRPVFVAVEGTETRVGVLDLSSERGELEVSYVFARHAWGRGLASEALPAVLRWAAHAFDIATVIAVTQAANSQSLRLLDRVGFVEETRMVEYDAEQIQLRWTAPLRRSRRLSPAVHSEWSTGEDAVADGRGVEGAVKAGRRPPAGPWP